MLFSIKQDVRRILSRLGKAYKGNHSLCTSPRKKNPGVAALLSTGWTSPASGSGSGRYGRSQSGVGPAQGLQGDTGSMAWREGTGVELSLLGQLLSAGPFPGKCLTTNTLCYGGGRGHMQERREAPTTNLTFQATNLTLLKAELVNSMICLLNA